MNDGGGLLLIGLIIFVVVFLILREFWCWYWKINLRVNLLTKQNTLLEEVASALRRGKSEQMEEKTKPQIDKLSNEKREEEPIGFVSLSGEEGEAFCLGCRKVSPKTELLYNKGTGEYYHEECLPVDAQSQSE